MNDLMPILEMNEVSLLSSTAHVGGLRGLTLALHRGEIAMVQLEEGREHSPLAALAQGLCSPDTGRVYFKGRDWSTMSAAEVARERGLIRRVYEHYGWITNMDVIENLCLAECYHSRRSREEVVQEVRSLARRFGMDSIPEARPTRVQGILLRKLEWVRAFVGKPELIILERPFFGAPKADAGRLIEAVCEVSGRGCAVLWLCDDVRAHACCRRATVTHYRMEGEELVKGLPSEERG